MLKKWQKAINLGFGTAGLAALAIGAFFLLLRPSHIPTSNLPPPKTTLPLRPFAQSKEAYEAIEGPFLQLQFAPMSMQLPDLKRYLVYYGKNGRPDATEENTLLHFSFTGNKSVSSLMSGERLYILYDRRLNPPQYVFSPGNVETSLWMEATVSPDQPNEALIQVTMKPEFEEPMGQQEVHASFTLPEKEYVRPGTAGWEIGKHRVDATLLARQKARWYGPDMFLARHGGMEYAAFVGKQRIDFGEGEETYSVYVGPQDSLVWERDRWKTVKPGAESLGKPLLLVKKMEERLMGLELWDPEGKGKVMLTLLKSTEPPQQSNLAQAFKFVGARTRTQFVFEIDGERVLLSPKDWLLKTSKGWIKLSTPQEIDDYVDRKTVGLLFVFDEVDRSGDRLILKGSLFNISRTDVQPVDILLQPPGTPIQKRREIPPKEADPDDDDDDVSMEYFLDDDDDDFVFDDDDEEDL